MVLNLYKLGSSLILQRAMMHQVSLEQWPMLCAEHTRTHAHELITHFCNRRAAHFAHFADDAGEEDEDNVHVGGNDVRPKQRGAVIAAAIPKFNCILSYYVTSAC